MLKHIKRLFTRNTSDSVVSKKDLDMLKQNIILSFDNIKKDSLEQKKWINHLYNSHKVLENNHIVMKEGHYNHEKTHNSDIENIHKWVSHLHDNSKLQEENLRKLEDNVAMAFEKYNKYLIDLFKIVGELKNNQESFVNDSKSPRIYSEIKSDDSAYSNVDARKDSEMIESDSDFDLDSESEIYSSNDDPPVKHYAKILTRAEKKIVAELCKTSQKLSYKDLSILTGLSISTIKNHICHIKNKSFPLKETNDSGGVKRHYVSDNIKKVLLSKTI